MSLTICVDENLILGPIPKVSPIKIIFIGHVVIKPKLMSKTKGKQQIVAATCQLPNIKMNSSNMVISKDFMKEGKDRHCNKEVQGNALQSCFP